MGHISEQRLALWHDKALERQQTLITLRKSFKYVKVSRDSWREKAIRYKSELARLTRENRALKKKLQQK